MIRLNLMQRISAVVKHFERVKGRGNTRPLLQMLKQDENLQLLVTTRNNFDREYANQIVTVSELALHGTKDKPTLVDHYVITELFGGAQKLVTILGHEIMRLNGGVISSDKFSPAYSPIASCAKVRVNGRYVDGCVTVDLNMKQVTAYKTNSNGKLVLVDGAPQLLTLKGEQVDVHFTLP